MPCVEVDLFFVGSDELADKYPMMDGMFLKENDLKKIPRGARANLITVLNVMDRNSLAQVTLPGDKGLDEFKVRYVANVIDQLAQAVKLGLFPTIEE